MRDFQEIQYLAWWVGLILIGTGIVLPIALIAAGRRVLRLGPSTGASARTKRAVTVLLGGAAAFAVLLSGWIFLSFGIITISGQAASLPADRAPLNQRSASSVGFCPAAIARPTSALPHRGQCSSSAMVQTLPVTGSLASSRPASPDLK